MSDDRRDLAILAGWRTPFGRDILEMSKVAPVRDLPECGTAKICH